MRRIQSRALCALALIVAAFACFAVRPAAAAPCSVDCLTPGDYDLSLTWAGYLRLYKVHVPASFDDSKPVALVLDLHGHALTNDDQRTRSGQLQQSDALGFIAVWPQGIANSWNGQGCCTVAYDLKIDDVGFLRTLIATIKQRANIDAEKVYVTGWSNGGGMAERMACEAADVVRAIASIAHPLNTTSCSPVRPVSVLEFHGTGDNTIPYGGGGTVLPREVLGVPLGWQAAPDSLTAWAAIERCTGTALLTPLPVASKDETYANCTAGTRVGLVTVNGADHDLYTPPSAALVGSTPDHVDIARYIWSHVFRP